MESKRVPSSLTRAFSNWRMHLRNDSLTVMFKDFIRSLSKKFLRLRHPWQRCPILLWSSDKSLATQSGIRVVGRLSSVRFSLQFLIFSLKWLITLINTKPTLCLISVSWGMLIKFFITSGHSQRGWISATFDERCLRQRIKHVEFCRQNWLYCSWNRMSHCWQVSFDFSKNGGSKLLRSDTAWGHNLGTRDTKNLIVRKISPK